MPEKVSNTAFSIDHLVTEVNTIVEDLRWLHFELKLRNHLNELLFHEVGSVEEFLKLGFEGFRAKMSVLELAVYLKTKQGYAIGFRDLEESVFWENDPVPWTENLDGLFLKAYEKEESPQPFPSHYSVNNSPITVITMPVVLNRDVAAVVLLVAHTSNLIPRFKKVLAGLSVALSVSINYIKNLRSQYKPQTLPVKLADNTLPYGDVVHFLISYTSQVRNAVLIADSLGNVIFWNAEAEAVTGRGKDSINTVADIRHLFDFSGGSEDIEGLFLSGALFDRRYCALRTRTGAWKNYVWSSTRIGTSKGALSVLTGWEDHPSDKSNSETAVTDSGERFHESLVHALTDIQSLFIVVIDSSMRVVYMNPPVCVKLGTEAASGQEFLQQFVPKHEHEYVKSALKAYFGSQRMRQAHEQFHLVSSENGTIPIDWHLGCLEDKSTNEENLWLFGSEVPDELFQVTPDSEMKHYPYRSPEAKLSKHYRFLMKYVPFPIVHLDGEKDIIRNANLAFETIIGTSNWESALISEFGALELHASNGDTQPCMLFIPNRDGITIPYRGILTPIQIFGKKVREIKLDPLD